MSTSAHRTHFSRLYHAWCRVLQDSDDPTTVDTGTILNDAHISRTLRKQQLRDQLKRLRRGAWDFEQHAPPALKQLVDREVEEFLRCSSQHPSQEKLYRAMKQSQDRIHAVLRILFQKGRTHSETLPYGWDVLHHTQSPNLHPIKMDSSYTGQVGAAPQNQLHGNIGTNRGTKDPTIPDPTSPMDRNPTDAEWAELQRLLEEHPEVLRDMYAARPPTQRVATNQGQRPEQSAPNPAPRPPRMVIQDYIPITSAPPTRPVQNPIMNSMQSTPSDHPQPTPLMAPAPTAHSTDSLSSLRQAAPSLLAQAASYAPQAFPTLVSAFNQFLYLKLMYKEVKGWLPGAGP